MFVLMEFQSPALKYSRVTFHSSLGSLLPCLCCFSGYSPWKRTDFCFVLFYFTLFFSCGEASFAPWWKGRASPVVTWRNDRWVYMTLSLSPRSEPEGMPWIGTVNATRGGNRIRTWVWIRKKQLLDPPGTPGVDSSPSTVGKAADGDLPLHNH